MSPPGFERHILTGIVRLIAAFVCLTPAKAVSAETGFPKLRYAQADTPAAPRSDQPPPPAATPQPPAQKPDASANETPALIINGQQVESILGKKVRNSAGDDIGRIVDIIVDKTGQIRAAIIDFGGFLGVGSRQIAIDWRTIRFVPDGKIDAVTIDLSKDQLRVAPVYKAGEQIVILNASATPAAPSVTPPPPPPSAAPANPAPKDSSAK